MFTLGPMGMGDPDGHVWLEWAAAERYERVNADRWLTKLRTYVTRRSCRLLDLTAVQHAGSTCARSSAGLRTVPIRQIRGSEGRCDDFDADFRPRQGHTRERWMSIAVAWLRGITLPPVELIQIGDTYFVRDGHHRISVAKAMGQPDIEALVTVRQVKGAAPSQQPMVGPSVQPAVS